MGKQRAVPAIFRRTVLDRKYKQMIYNIKQNVTKIQPLPFESFRALG